MNTARSAHRPEPRYFHGVEREDFVRLEHAASLKGLLRPFKSKGELLAFCAQCESLRDGLIGLAQRLLAQATARPLGILPAVLAQQTTGSGTTFLRWRSADRAAMGVLQWEQLVAQPSTPPALVPELFALELERIALNMQISLTHSIARRASECVARMSRAEAVYLRRVEPSLHTISKESAP